MASFLSYHCMRGSIKIWKKISAESLMVLNWNCSCSKIFSTELGPVLTPLRIQPPSFQPKFLQICRIAGAWGFLRQFRSSQSNSTKITANTELVMLSRLQNRKKMKNSSLPLSLWAILRWRLPSVSEWKTLPWKTVGSPSRFSPRKTAAKTKTNTQTNKKVQYVPVAPFGLLGPLRWQNCSLSFF